MTFSSPPLDSNLLKGYLLSTIVIYPIRIQKLKDNEVVTGDRLWVHNQI